MKQLIQILCAISLLPERHESDLSINLSLLLVDSSHSDVSLTSGASDASEIN